MIEQDKDGERKGARTAMFTSESGYEESPWPLTQCLVDMLF